MDCQLIQHQWSSGYCYYKEFFLNEMETLENILIAIAKYMYMYPEPNILTSSKVDMGCVVSSSVKLAWFHITWW